MEIENIESLHIEELKDYHEKKTFCKDESSQIIDESMQ